MPAVAVDLIRDVERAQSILQPIRLRLLEDLRQPDSAAGLARRLGLPRQKLNYHLRELEKHGFVELVEERRKGNCVERLVRATARSYLVDPAALGALAADPDRMPDRLSASYLVAVAARAIRDLAALRGKATAAGKRIATLTLQTDVRFATAETRHAFASELSKEIARLAAKYHDETAPGGRRFRFFLGGYPDPRSERERVAAAGFKDAGAEAAYGGGSAGRREST
jgi:DNA-binding transcriptional ArsR family regulator